MKKKQTKQLFRIVLILASLGSLAFVPWVLVKAWVKPLSSNIQDQVEEALEYDLDGIIVYVDQTGQPPQFYTGGWHNRENQIPANPQAFFKIASISKLYNAVAITKLVQANMLSLDESVAVYFPHLVGRIENAESITLRMLVQHRSGIPNYSNHPRYWENPPDSRTKTLELALDLPANFEPGEDYEYCNTNYLLIGALMDSVLGYNRHQYIQQEILNRLKLQNTYFSLHDIPIDQLMSGYFVGVDEDIKTNNYGSMIATAQDVGIFLRALNDGSIFDENGKEIYSSIYVYEHSGWVPGYQSFAEYHKDLDAVVVLFNNTNDADLILWNLSEIILNRIVEILHHEKR